MIDELDRYKKALHLINFELIQLFKYIDSIEKIFMYTENLSHNLLEFESLFYEVQRSFKDQAVLSLSNIIVDDRESINIHYLSRYYQSNARKHYDSKADSEIQDSFQKILENLKSEEITVDIIKGIRDKFIAHLDKENLSYRNTKYKVTLEDLRRIGGILLEITTINFHAGIGNEMWDFLPSFGICSDIDKILKTKESKENLK
jgi:hypothetical protein